MQKVENTYLSQYANSDTLTALIETINDALDPSNSIDDFYNRLWNVNTAEGYGLDVWGRIVGVSRVIYVPSVISGNFFGFQEAGDPEAEFGQSPFYNGAVTQSYILSDDDFRLLIKVKACANKDDCSIPSLNLKLMVLFPGRGNAYVIDNNDMTMTLAFTFSLRPVEVTILEQTGVFPVPTGVSFTTANYLTISLNMSEGVSNTDSADSIVQVVKAVQEGSNVTDTKTLTSTLVRVQTEGSNATNASTQTAQLPKATTEGANVTDASNQAGNLIKVDAEGANTTDASTITATITKVTTEGINNTDAPTLAAVFGRSVSEQSNFTDTSTEAAVLGVTDVEGANLTDAPNRATIEHVAEQESATVKGIDNAFNPIKTLGFAEAGRYTGFNNGIFYTIEDNVLVVPVTTVLLLHLDT